MSKRIPDKPAGTYGVDAMMVPVGLSAGAALYLVLTISSITHPTPLWIRISYGIAVIVFGVSALLFWYATLYGKFRTWATILDSLSLL